MTEAAAPAGRVRGRKRRFAKRWVRRAVLAVSALAAALLVTLFTIDLQHLPGDLRRVAEHYGTNYLGRPLHIGRLSAYLTPGDFRLDDVMIDGKRPGDRPFFTADHIIVHLNWYPLLRFSRAQRNLDVEVRLSGWRMLFERWTDGHNMPNLVPKGGGKGTLPFTTTVSVYAAGAGEFDYDDHATPWSVKAPNLTFALVRAENLRQYVGRASFSGGEVQILGYRPMRTDLVTRFTLDGKLVRLQHIDLTTEGTTSHVNGVVDFGHWPRQTYNITSTVDFATMRDIFFGTETWHATGEGHFTGVFQFAENNSRELSGEFTSPLARIDDLEFPDLHGALVWTPTRFEVTHADADFLGGTARLNYSLAPLGTPSGATATFTADYSDVSLDGLDRLIDLKGLRLIGRGSGRLALQWPNGRFHTGRHGEGEIAIAPPPGAPMAPAELPATPIAAAFEPKPFQPARRLRTLPIGGEVFFKLDPDGWTFGDSRVMTSHTNVRFSGRLASTGASSFPFHVTSHDWQESDRVLAAIMTAMNAPTGAVEVGGRGTFDGRMTGTFAAPRIEGRFSGEAIRAWDVTWGRAEGDIVIHDRYVDISNSRIGDRPDASIKATGRYALGYRPDDQEEIHADITMVNWPMADLRHAFNLDDWRVDGTVGRAVLKLTGRYRTMTGTGDLVIDHGMAWKERFDEASGQLDLDGTGMHVGGILMTKGPGTVHGDLRVRWDGTYAFRADGSGVLVNTLDNFKLDRAPLSGALTFTADGEGEFSAPRYNFKGTVRDLHAGDESIGDVEGQFSVADNTLNIQRVVAHSDVLADVDAKGSIVLNDRSDADLHLTFTGCDVFPYIKFIVPKEAIPSNHAILSGSIDVDGPLAYPHELLVAGSIYDAKLHVFNYDLANDGDVEMGFRHDAFEIGRLKLTGENTNLELSGGADVAKRQWRLSASGDADLAIIRAFPLAIDEASGAATVHGTLTGAFDAPSLSGTATVTDGRLRPRGSAHSLEGINGPITFDDKGINLTGLRGRIGNGQVVFGGNITLHGFAIGDYNLTATGRQMKLRYPQGMSSTVNMDLVLVGPKDAPVLRGRVDVLRASLSADVNADAGVFGLAAAAGVTGPAAAEETTAAATPLAMDINVFAPRMPFIDQKTQRVEGTGQLHIGGTFDRPSITGIVDIVSGELELYGNRYFVREGSIRFINPNHVEPVLDVSAETRPRIATQVFVINVRITGTLNQADNNLRLTMTSDPFLSETQIFSVLFGGTIDVGAAEQQALQSSQELQQRTIQTAGAALLASAVNAKVGAVVEKTLPIDTLQITPMLATDPNASLSLNPTARVTFGKRLSPRAYLTYSRTLNTPDQVMLLEYEESDRLSWVLSRNEDRSFSLDFRIRHVF